MRLWWRRRQPNLHYCESSAVDRFLFDEPPEEPDRRGGPLLAVIWQSPARGCNFEERPGHASSCSLSLFVPAVTRGWGRKHQSWKLSGVLQSDFVLLWLVQKLRCWLGVCLDSFLFLGFKTGKADFDQSVWQVLIFPSFLRVSLFPHLPFLCTAPTATLL